jgi:pyruvate carboxylase
LIQSGYLDFARWSNPRQNQNLPSRTSRIRPSLQLQDKFTELSLSPLGIAHNYLQETVILTDYETDEEGNYTKSNDKKKRQYIDYDDIDFTKDILRDLEAYNQLLRSTYVDIATLEEPFVFRTKKDGSTQRIKIDQSKNFVRRIFSRGDWNYNGRFYGGFWQQVGSEYRKNIYINDNPTVEVDYKGLHAAIHGAKKNVVNDGDRYDLGDPLPNVIPLRS